MTDPPLTARPRRPARHQGAAQARARPPTAAPPAAVDSLDGTDEALHNVRKAAKRLRHAAEVAVPAVGKPADRTRRRARKVTKVLGEHQDSVVVRPVLRELGVQAHLAGENGFTFGLLHQREADRAAAAEARFGAAWDRVAAKKHRAWLELNRRSLGRVG